MAKQNVDTLEYQVYWCGGINEGQDVTISFVSNELNINESKEGE